MKIKYCVLLSILIACKTSEKNLVGIYADNKKKDTLTLLADHTFEYKLKQDNSEFGWNNGTWIIKGTALSFVDTKPDPLVGFRLKKKVTGNTRDALRLVFKLTIPHKEMKIHSVLVLNNGSQIDSGNYKIHSNQLILTTDKFDSIDVSIPYFPTITLSKKMFESQKIYEVLITPSDRLYELDKGDFKSRRKSIFDRVQKVEFKRIS